jgi:hypothetical protein
LPSNKMFRRTESVKPVGTWVFEDKDRALWSALLADPEIVTKLWKHGGKIHINRSA